MAEIEPNEKSATDESPDTEMICPQCGSETQGDFCTQCGAPLLAPTPQVEPAAEGEEGGQALLGVSQAQVDRQSADSGPTPV